MRFITKHGIGICLDCWRMQRPSLEQREIASFEMRGMQPSAVGELIVSTWSKSSWQRETKPPRLFHAPKGFATLMMGGFLKEPEATFKWYRGSVKGLAPHDRAVYLLYLAQKQRVRSGVFADAPGWDASWVDALDGFFSRSMAEASKTSRPLIQSKFKKGWVPSLEP